jgi:hypothetical protein
VRRFIAVLTQAKGCDDLLQFLPRQKGATIQFADIQNKEKHGVKTLKKQG